MGWCRGHIVFQFSVFEYVRTNVRPSVRMCVRMYIHDPVRLWLRHPCTVDTFLVGICLWTVQYPKPCYNEPCYKEVIVYCTVILQTQMEDLRQKMGATLSERYTSTQKGTAKMMNDYEKMRKDLMRVCMLYISWWGYVCCIQWTLITTTAFVPKDIAIKTNLLLYRILNEQIDM